MNNATNKEAKALNKTNVEIGVRITVGRKQLRLTQETASEATDISPRSFACIGRDIKNVGARNVIKVANALGVSIDYILSGTTNKMDGSKPSEMLKPLS